MNLIYSRHRASHSPQDILFGLTKPTKQDAIVPPQILDVCETEDGLMTAIDMVQSDGLNTDEANIISKVREADQQFVDITVKETAGSPNSPTQSLTSAPISRVLTGEKSI